MQGKICKSVNVFFLFDSIESNIIGNLIHHPNLDYVS